MAVAAAPSAQATVLTASALAGEGDAAPVRVSRAAGAAGRLDLRTADGTLLAITHASVSEKQEVPGRSPIARLYAA